MSLSFVANCAAANIELITKMKSSMVPCVAWVGRGVPKMRPDKVKLKTEDLRQLLQGANADETSDTSDNENDNAIASQNKRGLRGSKGNLDDDDDDGDKSESKTDKRYDMDNYDRDEKKDENIGTAASALSGIACYASPFDDPNLKHPKDVDDPDDTDEDDREDFELKPDDNLVVVGRVVKDEYTMEVWVYNEANDDWYTHHDYILEAPPLCFETIGYDPGADDDNNRTGNLVAVGTMQSSINIWDLDIVNAVEPVVRFDGVDNNDIASSHSKRRKRDGSAQCHNDAVLCLAWNRLSEHVLASGSADSTIILWDIDEAKAASILTCHRNKIQSIQWHPSERSLLLSASIDGTVTIVDARTSSSTDTASTCWSFDDVEIEQVLWNHFSPFYFLVAGDDGILRYCDSRKTRDVLTCVNVYESDEIAAISLSAKVNGMLATIGNEMIKVWQIKDDGSINFVADNCPKIGHLHCARFCPDSDTKLVVGGERDGLVRVVDLGKTTGIKQTFNLES